MVHTISGGRRWQIDAGSPGKTTSEGKAPNQNLTPNIKLIRSLGSWFRGATQNASQTQGLRSLLRKFDILTRFLFPHCASYFSQNIAPPPPKKSMMSPRPIPPKHFEGHLGSTASWIDLLEWNEIYPAAPTATGVVAKRHFDGFGLTIL